MKQRHSAKEEHTSQNKHVNRDKAQPNQRQISYRTHIHAIKKSEQYGQNRLEKGQQQH